MGWVLGPGKGCVQGTPTKTVYGNPVKCNKSQHLSVSLKGSRIKGGKVSEEKTEMRGGDRNICFWWHTFGEKLF